MKRNWVWLVQGFDELTRLFHFELSPVLSEREVEALSQRLASNDLTPGEIVNASLRKGMKGHDARLTIQREPRERVIMWVGLKPHYVASQLFKGEEAEW